MLKIVLNGQTHEVAAGATVREILLAAGYAQRKVAVEINREIVPRSAHTERLVREGDCIEIVNAIGGG